MLVRVSTHQNVTVELSLHGRQSLIVTPGDHLMTMDDSNLKVVDLDYLGLGQACSIVAIATHNMGLAFRGGQVLQPFDRLQKQSVVRHGQSVVSKMGPLL